jgi:DNA (cytosine-5)-methyltransferase 1
MSKQYTVIDLFSGAGGLSQGFEFYNSLNEDVFEICAGLDSNERALATFHRNHSCANTFSEPVDLHDWSGEEILAELDHDSVDVVLGGPPCQGFSHAGDRDPDDERNELVFKFHDLVDELGPSFFVMENVPGLKVRKRMEEDPFINQLEERFSESGYELSILDLNAADFGVPQNRKRLFIVGNNRGVNVHSPPPTHGSQKDLSMDREPLVTVEEAIMDLPDPTWEDPQAYDRNPNSEYSSLMRGQAKELYNHTPADHKEETIEKMEDQEPGEGLYDWNHSWIRLELDKPSPTVKANNRAPSVHPTQHRVTTPRECARLQSFPDDYVFVGPKSRVLEQIGNAVPPLLGRVLAEIVAKGMEATLESSQKSSI